MELVHRENYISRKCFGFHIIAMVATFHLKIKLLLQVVVLPPVLLLENARRRFYLT